MTLAKLTHTLLTHTLLVWTYKKQVDKVHIISADARFLGSVNQSPALDPYGVCCLSPDVVSGTITATSTMEYRSWSFVIT